MIFDIPETFRENKTIPVTDEVVRPWLEEIKRIWHDQSYYADLCQKVEKEAVQHDIAHNAERFIRAVSPVVLESKGIKPPQSTPVQGSDVLKQALARKQANNARRNQARKKK